MLRSERAVVNSFTMLMRMRVNVYIARSLREDRHAIAPLTGLAPTCTILICVRVAKVGVLSPLTIKCGGARAPPCPPYVSAPDVDALLRKLKSVEPIYFKSPYTYAALQTGFKLYCLHMGTTMSMITVGAKFTSYCFYCHKILSCY